MKSRGEWSRSPGQYATPRRLTLAGAVYRQITFAVSGSSAMTSLPAETYMIPPTTSGVTSIPVAPVSNVQARCSFATFAGVICFSGENRCAPGSRSCIGQSLRSAASVETPAHATATRIARMCLTSSRPKSPTPFGSDTRQQIELARAVAEPLDVHAELVHQAQRQIRERRSFRIPEVSIAFHLLIAAADDDDRNVVVVVSVAVAHAAAVE